MGDNQKIRNLHLKYMALAHSGNETDVDTAREIAKQILKFPMEYTTDFNFKIKILETELLKPSKSAIRTRYDLLELLAVMAQSEFKPRDPFYSSLPGTIH